MLAGGVAALVAAAAVLALTRSPAAGPRQAVAPSVAERAPTAVVRPPDRTALELPLVVVPPALPATPREAPTHPRALIARLDGDAPEVTLLGVPLAGPHNVAPRLADLQPKLAAALRSNGVCAAEVGGDGAWAWPESGIVLHQGWSHDCSPDGAVTGVTVEPARGVPWIVETSHGAVVLARAFHQLPDDFPLWASFQSDAPGPRYIMHAHVRCGPGPAALTAASAFTLTIGVAKGRPPSAAVDLTCVDLAGA
jgi:hypothetical protein